MTSWILHAQMKLLMLLQCYIMCVLSNEYQVFLGVKGMVIYTTVAQHLEWDAEQLKMFVLSFGH